MHVKRLWLERNGELLRTAAIRQQLLVSRWVLQQVGKNYRFVIAAQEVPLSAAQREEGKIVLVTPTLIYPQATEEENQELFIFKAGDKVLHFGVIKKKLSLMVDVVEILSDAGFGALALDVGSGASGGDVAAWQAASIGQSSAASSR